MARTSTRSRCWSPRRHARSRRCSPAGRRSTPTATPSESGNGAQGLAEDIRHYGQWMRVEAERRIGHLYPKVEVTEAAARERADLRPHVGRKLTVIAWLWARTVASPDPMVRGAHVPLVSSFVLSSRKGNEAVVVPVVDRGSGTYRFTVKSGEIDPDAVARARRGTKAEGSAGFTCVVTGAPMSGDTIRTEGRAGRLGARLMAVVAEGKRGRIYLEPSEEMEETARAAEPAWKPDVEFFQQALGFRIGNYGMSKWSDLFTSRQLVALTTFSDLIPEVRGKVLADARAAGTDADATAASGLAAGGSGAEAYADAVATYLGLCVSRQANRCSSLSFWDPGGAKVQQVFARQALPPVWDFCESNPFSDSSGNFIGQLGYLANVVAAAPSTRVKAQGAVIQQDAAGDTPLLSEAVIATDPPYYDNIGYADLSDFFYVWQRRALFDVWPDLFRRVLTPKEEELVATPHRHGGKDAAESFFMEGMSRALRNMHRSGADDFPVTLYYAFKQSEVAKEGLTSPGWATFLQGVVDAGYLIDGTWPVRTELAIALKKKKSALASSIVLVCRKRSPDAPVITRREFIARLRATLPLALRNIRAGGVGPVDMAQAAIGPGMGVFTTASKVLEPDDAPMTVRNRNRAHQPGARRDLGRGNGRLRRRYPLLHRLVRGVRHERRHGGRRDRHGAGLRHRHRPPGERRRVRREGWHGASAASRRASRRLETRDRCAPDPLGVHPASRAGAWRARRRHRGGSPPAGGHGAGRRRRGAGPRLPPLRHLRTQGPGRRGAGVEHAGPGVAGR